MPDYSLVLIAPAAGPALTAGLVEDIRKHLAGNSAATPQWLAPNEAGVIAFEAPGEEEAQALAHAIRSEIVGPGSHLLDVALVPGGVRPRKLLVADMESTIIEQECLDELAGHVGLRPRISSITARAMRGELEFEDALRARVGLLKGIDASILDRVYADVTLMPGAETLVRTMLANGATCALVSGGFQFFTQRIAARLGFHSEQANRLEIAGKALTGRVEEPILGRDAKLAALHRLTRELALEPADTMAVGDGANDLAMIGAAGLGVAFRAKPLVAAQARVSIVHGDLTALLYLQGYRREEFVDR